MPGAKLDHGAIAPAAPLISSVETQRSQAVLAGKNLPLMAYDYFVEPVRLLRLMALLGNRSAFVGRPGLDLLLPRLHRIEREQRFIC